jgi:hypothetical protein
LVKLPFGFDVAFAVLAELLEMIRIIVKIESAGIFAGARRPRARHLLHDLTVGLVMLEPQHLADRSEIRR